MSLGLFGNTKALAFFVERMKKPTKHKQHKRIEKRIYKIRVPANVIAMIGLSCYILADFFISLKIGQTGLATQFIKSVIQSRVSIGMMLPSEAEQLPFTKARKTTTEANDLYAHGRFIVALLRLFLLYSAC